MNTRYFSNSRNHRIAVLLLAGMAAFGSVKAQTQTFNSDNYIKSTQDLKVEHKQSFLAERANDANMPAFPPEFLQADEGWKTNEYGKQVQNTSEYYTTRYVKRGEWSPLFLTTTNNHNNENNNNNYSRHLFYQRWYYYDASGNEKPLPEEYYAPEFKAYVYSNGLVMGQRLYNYKNVNNQQNLSNGTQPVYYSILSRLPLNEDIKSLEIGADLSRYSDMEYASSATNNNVDNRAKNSGNLTEPSLTLRHHFKLVDANVMARKLTSKTGSEWLEEHTIHFPNRSIGVHQDHVPLDLELQDYWFYSGGIESEDNLQNITSDDYVTVQVVYPDGQNLGLRDVAFVDAPNTNRNNDYFNIINTANLRRRLIAFNYPIANNGIIPAGSKAEIRVYARESNSPGAQRYNLARFILIFDDKSEVLPWMDIVGENANPSLNYRSPQGLYDASGADPVAHIDFDFIPNQTFKNPPTGNTNYMGGGNSVAPNHAFDQSSALPLSFEHTSYGFAPFVVDNVYNWCIWGEYAIGKETGQNYSVRVDGRNIDYNMKVHPVSQKTGKVLNNNMSSGFLYIDASNLPGTVGSVPFQGTFCRGTKLMCTGWMASITNSAPGSVILKVIGKDGHGGEKELFAFCPGQIGRSYRKYGQNNLTVSSHPNDNVTQGDKLGEFCWQQFYFEFLLDELSVSYDLRIENNCESTQGGDYFLDDVWVYAQLPKVGPEMETPLCGGNLDVVQLETNYDPLLQATGYTETTNPEAAQKGYLSFVYLDWDKFLLTFMDGLSEMGVDITKDNEGRTFGPDGTSPYKSFGDVLINNINNGYYDVTEYQEIYHDAFKSSLIRNKIVNDEDGSVTYGNAVYGNFQFSSRFADHEEFSFSAMALDPDHKVYGMTIENTNQRRLIFNGSLGIDQWDFYHNYALLTTVGETALTDEKISDEDDLADLYFNVLNKCSNRSILWFAPKIQIVSKIGAISIEELEFCENTNQTFPMELTGILKPNPEDAGENPYTGEPGEPIELPEVYFDWWMGIPKSTANPQGVPATVENYKEQHITYVEDGVEKKLYLYDAIRCFRFRNPDVTNLYSPNIKFGQNPLYANVPAFTQRMLDYLRSLANPADGSKPQLYIHTKIVDVQINEENVFEEDYLGETQKYVWFVAIPIESNLNEAAKDFVYICAEPQPFKVKVGDHAPHMQVGFSEKHYPAGLGTLSVRISKSQFEKLVDHGDGKYNELHIPLRDIKVITPSCVGVKTPELDDNLRYVRIANSTDALMQAYITANMIFDENNSWPPEVGMVDYLVGKHDDFWPTPADYQYPNEQRMLKMHFSKDFQVREGYSYTLRYYFIEDLNDGFNFTCNGNADIIIKIVPDYEVWTGGADNTDWSNDENWRRADYDELYAGNGTTLKDTYLPNGTGTQPYSQTNYVTDEDRERMQGFAPLYCTNILMMTSENTGYVTTETAIPDTDPTQYQIETTFKVKPASLLYDLGPEMEADGVTPTGFPKLLPTASPLIRYDFQAHEWDGATMSDQLAEAKVSAEFRDDGDMITELYVDNVCGNIAFQSETELINAHLLDYNKAWVEFALPKNQWHLVSSPLQGTLSGEWYAPTWSGRQETTYYEPITFDETHNHMAMKGISGNYPAGLGYDRFAPAVYQRQWDKAKAVLYERGAVWSADDASQSENLGYGEEGEWSGTGEGFTWDHQNADDYLNRLVYKPFDVSKINVAVRGSWSGAHNDHTVPYDNGGFSVMPINNLKAQHNEEDVKTIFRLPKDDQYYDIWDWNKTYGIERRVRVYINDGRPLLDGATATNTVTLNNRGRLRSDFFATPIAAPTTEDPTATVAPEVYEVTLKNEGKGSLGYFLASNPFICGLDMVKFFQLNKDVVKPYYLVMKDSDIDPNLTDAYLDTQPEGTTWKWTDMNFAGFDSTVDGDGTDLQGNTIVPPRYAFFVKSKDDAANEITLKYTTKMMVHTPRTVPEGTTTGGGSRLWMTISAQRDGNSSEARVMKSPSASNKFMPEEDLETFVVSDITSNIPVVYTLTGRLATSINRIHDFMVLPIGIESNSDEPATVTFQGVEMLGDSLMLYDAKTGEAVPLHSGFTTRMPGRTQNRFFIVQGSSLKEALAESNLQIFGEDGIIVVTSTTGQPITDVRVYDAGGRQVYVAAPGRNEHRFRLSKGIYVVKANTEDARQVKKISN